MTRLALLGLAGAFGTLARYGLCGLIQRHRSLSYPLGTLAVNSIGCLLFGMVWTLAEERQILTPETRFLILVGFLGAFTTFSTFAFETGQMLRDSQWLLAGAHLGAGSLLGIVCLFLGIALGRLV